MKQTRTLLVLALLLAATGTATAQSSWDLTPSNNNKTWTLTNAPGYDLDLEVTYYGIQTLSNIPEGWTVTVDDAEVTITEGVATLNEGDSVVLSYEEPDKVKSVTLESVPELVNVDGIELLIAPGDTWAQIIERNSDVIRFESGYIKNTSSDVLMIFGGSMVAPTDTYSPDANYDWQV